MAKPIRFGRGGFQSYDPFGSPDANNSSRNDLFTHIDSGRLLGTNWGRYANCRRNSEDVQSTGRTDRCIIGRGALT